MRIQIFGARSVALGVCKAIQTLYPEQQIDGFLVTSLDENPAMLCGLPVKEIGEVAKDMTDAEKKDLVVLVATPEDVHSEIEQVLKRNGFMQYIFIDSVKEAALMERFFEKEKRFPSLHNLTEGEHRPEISIYAVKCGKDKKLENTPDFPEYVHSVFAGDKEKIEERKKQGEIQIDFFDDTGEHISFKNPNYCELTAFYWVWKNRLNVGTEYVGMCHYRRSLDFSAHDLKRLKENNVDVVLQFPMLHEPDIKEHHTRYIREEDWYSMLCALEELYPEYAKVYDQFFSQPYFYSHNLILAKTQVFEDYCAWLFPLLEKIEELSSPKGWERGDRYIAYISESLLTLYFLYHDELNLYHTGRRMYI